MIEPLFQRYEIYTRATRYIGYRNIDVDGSIFVVLVTGWSGNNGQWVRLREADVAWRYITEKMPALTEGDKEGWVKLFAEMGITVFG